jgi:hypothetical protein
VRWTSLITGTELAEDPPLEKKVADADRRAAGGPTPGSKIRSCKLLVAGRVTR